VKIRAGVALALAAALAGCGENNDQRAASKTVSQFYEALKLHDAEGVCERVSPAFATALARSEKSNGCVPALRSVFGRVDPHLFDTTPKVVAATIRGDNAIVVITRGYQRRHIALSRSGDGWRISGSADLHP
jgi:hypothetical protein